MCIEGPVVYDIVTAFFMVLSSFWLVSILATIGMKFAGAFKGENPVLVRGYIWAINKLSKNIVCRILFHGGILAITTLIPLFIKIKILIQSA